MHQTPVSTRTVTLTLAYLDHYNCKFVSGLCLPVPHLRTLAEWIGAPAPELRSARAHQCLAAHLALLAAAGLLRHDSGYWRCAPSLYAWLKATTAEQYAWLLRPFTAGNLWQEAVEHLGLQETLPIDYAAFVRQHLARQSRRPDSTERGYAAWLEITEETWQLSMPVTLPLPALFNLLQLGQWRLDKPLRCTPLSIATAGRRGFSLTRMEMIFIAATGQSLTDGQMQQLLDWYKRGHARPRCLFPRP